MTAVIEKVTIDCGHDRQATLYLGDSYLIIPDVTDADDWRLDDVACVMDPPYKFDTSGGGKLRKTRKNMDEIEAEGLNEGFDVSILDTGDGHWCASAVVFCHNDQLAELMPALDARFHRLALLAWRKINPMPVANKAYVPELEPYLHGWNPGAHPVGALRDLRRIWDGPVGVNEFDHPTQKPINLMRKILRNVSAPVIVDPFMGTGTTGAAAIEAGRRFIGIEHNPKHFATAVKRLRELVKWRGDAPDLKAPGADEPPTCGKQEAML